MKRHIWADPKKEWDGFRLTAYSLDMKVLGNLPLTQKRAADEKIEQIPTTVGEIFSSLADRHVEVDSHVLDTGITTDTEELVFAGPSFIRQMLEELLKLRNEGVNPFFAQWFWYDSDSCRDDLHELYSFFVVHDDRIVRERITFSDYHGSGFNPSLFQAADDSDSIWFNDTAWREAGIRFWYHKFYTETRTGRLMLLRDDEPKLYDYESHRDPDMAALLRNVPNLLGKIHVLLWVLIVLVGFVLIRLWK